MVSNEKSTVNQNGQIKDGTANEDEKSNENKEKTSFEEALQLTGIGRYNYSLLAISMFTLMAAFAEIFSIGTIVTTSQCDLELDIKKKGFINSVPMLGVAAGSHFWGYLADTRGRKFAVIASTGGTLIATLLSSFANQWIFMIVIKFCSAICAFGSNAIIFTLLAESTPISHRGRFLFYASTGLMSTQAKIILLSYPTLHLTFSYYLPFLNFYYRPWRLLIQLFGVTNGLSFLLLWLFVFESPKFLFAMGDNEKGLAILKRIYSINNNKCDMQTYSVQQVILEEDINQYKKRNIFRSMWDQTIPLFYKQHIKNTFLVCYICIIAYCVSPPFVIWMPEIFNSYSKIEDADTTFCQMFQTKVITTANITEVDTVCNDTIAEISFAAMGALSLYLPIASMILTIVLKYTGKKWAFIGTAILAAIFSLIVNHVQVIWGIFALLSMMVNIVTAGITTSYAVELFPTYMRAMAVSLTIMVGRGVSFGFISIIGSQLLTNCNNYLYFLAAFCISGAIVGLFLPSEKLSKKDGNDVENVKYSENNTNGQV